MVKQNEGWERELDDVIVQSCSVDGEKVFINHKVVKDYISSLLKTEREMADKMSDHVMMLLPMAKGYAYKDKIESNMKIIRKAEEALKEFEIENK